MKLAVGRAARMPLAITVEKKKAKAERKIKMFNRLLNCYGTQKQRRHLGKQQQTTKQQAAPSEYKKTVSSDTNLGQCNKNSLPDYYNK